MKKFYNNPAWRRIRGLRGLGVLALSVAFCLTGLLALSSCDLDFLDDDDDEPVSIEEWRGFFVSIDIDRMTNCQSEYLRITTLSEDVVVNKPNIKVVSSAGPDFGGAVFPQTGVKVGATDHHQETIATTYVSENKGVVDRPGAYFLVAREDADISADPIYTGYWSGYAYRPGGDGAEKPVVICPYVAVPADTSGLGKDDIEDGECGDNDQVHADLAKYLEDGNDGLRDCHNLLDSDGVLDPMERQ